MPAVTLVKVPVISEKNPTGFDKNAFISPDKLPNNFWRAASAAATGLEPSVDDCWANLLSFYEVNCFPWVAPIKSAEAIRAVNFILNLSRKWDS